MGWIRRCLRSWKTYRTKKRIHQRFQHLLEHTIDKNITTREIARFLEELKQSKDSRFVLGRRVCNITFCDWCPFVDHGCTTYTDLISYEWLKQEFLDLIDFSEDRPEDII